MLFEDQFTIKVEDETAKINVNGSVKKSLNITDQLLRLFGCPVEKAFLESKGLTPEILAYRIGDFLAEQDSVSPESELDGKDTPYERFTPPYAAKRLPLDSVDELKLVAGWDDDIHTVFSPYLTVYPFINRTKNKDRSYININTAPKELISCLIPESLDQSCAEKFAQSMHNLREKEGSSSVSTNKKGIKEKLKEVACLPDDGDDDDAIKPLEWFEVKSNIYRITVQAQTGNQEVILEMVVQRLNPGESDVVTKKLKEKKPYRVLYWKLI